MLICSLNAPSLLKHKPEIEVLLHDNNIDILALNETKLDPNILKCHTHINGYHHERFDRNRHGGGVCIYIKNTINCEVHTDIPNNELETICLEIKPKCSKSFVIIAWYRPPKYNALDIDDIKNVYQFFDTKDKEIIFLGDTNCDDLPEEGKNAVVRNLRNFYREFHMKQLIKKPTRTTNISSTIIDHFATNRPNFIGESGVKTIGFSDHDLIFGMRKISIKTNNVSKNIRYRNLKHYHVDRFCDELRNVNWFQNIDLNDVHQLPSTWEKQFLEVLDRHAPLKARKVRNSYAPYIDNQLKRKMFLRDSYKKRYTDNKNIDDWKAYKKLKNEVNINMKCGRKKYFSDKLLETKGDVNGTWKVLNSALGKRSKTTQINSLVIDNQEITNPEDIVTNLNKHFTNIAEKTLKESEQDYCRIKKFHRVLDYTSKLPRTGERFRFAQISNTSIINAVSGLKNSKSGTLPAKFLKDCISVVASSLGLIFNKSIQLGIYPNNLKIARICPIYKGKGSKSNPDNYRPISVLSVIARTFEKLVHGQLSDFLKDSFYKFQLGFRRNHSTQTALLNTTNEWFVNIDKGKYNLAVFIDLRKAFDTVNHDILLFKLSHYGVIGTELRWFKSYLSNRQQYCSLSDSNSDLALVTSGIPQGSCLGPLLFLIYINDIHCAIQNSKTEIYADDTNVSNSSHSIALLEKEVNDDLYRLCCWLQANKLSVNKSESKFMIIASPSYLKNLTTVPDIKILNKSIERVFQIDHLGVTIDDSLKWDKHVSNLGKKLASTTYSMKLASFLPSSSLLTIYRSLFESRLRYCDVVWGSCNNNLKEKLQRQQDRAIHIVTKQRLKNNTEQAYNELEILNVQQLIDFDTSTMMFKLISGTTPDYLIDLFVPASQIHGHYTRHAMSGFYPY